MKSTLKRKQMIALPAVTVGTNVGLTTEQVEERVRCNLSNKVKDPTSITIGKILQNNIFTLFNLINVVLLVILFLLQRYQECWFFLLAVVNSAIGIIQELRSKKTLDKLSILAKSNVVAIRNGQKIEITQQEVVRDDILLYQAGNQIVADGVIVDEGELELDESMLTGESDKIKKTKEELVYSGSIVTAGKALIQVTAVGIDNYANKLTVEAKKQKNPTAPLVKTLNNIIKVLSIAIVPLGLLLIYRSYSQTGDFTDSIVGATSAILGMIPEGLILLTSVTLTVSAVKLARKKVLVQSLPSIETLARIDVLCLDKTGTITDGTLKFEYFELEEPYQTDEAKEILQELLGALEDENATATALKKHFDVQKNWLPTQKVPFSSVRKWSGASFENKGTFVLGAPSYLFGKENQEFLIHVNQFTSKGYRVLALGKSLSPFQEDDALPNDLDLIGLVILSDNIREEAPDTFGFFKQQGVEIKVISGDDPQTVSTIAQKAKIEKATQFVDMSEYSEDENFQELVKQYTVFGRVSPYQKRGLIRALKQNGHITCMTGDGVNDVLAMKESDCSIAMVEGSDAARGASEFVLLNSDFSTMVDVLNEGRRVINNIEIVACMYLVKTIYSFLLTLTFSALGSVYPFTPAQMGPINSLTVGIPTFFLALRGNYRKPTGKFLRNIFENSVPAALIIVMTTVYLYIIQHFFDLPKREIATICIIMIAIIGFTVMTKMARPLSKRFVTLIVSLMAAFGCTIVFFQTPMLLKEGSLLANLVYDTFPLSIFPKPYEDIFNPHIFLYAPIAVALPFAFEYMSWSARKIFRHIDLKKNK